MDNSLTHQERSIAVAACRAMLEMSRQPGLFFFRSFAEEEALERAIIKLCKIGIDEH